MEKTMKNKTRKCTRRIDPERFKEEAPRLSGAYIRTLVKQLTTSSRPPKQDDEPSTKISPTDKFSEGFGEAQGPQQVNKKVRRRLHTSKPYQERLLNMAEARREIVAALKFHRATMRQPQTEANSRELQESPKVQPTANFNYPTLGVPSSSSSPSLSPFVTSADDVLNVTLSSRAPGINLNFHQQSHPNPCFFMNSISDNRNQLTIPFSSSLPSSSILEHKNPIKVLPPFSPVPVDVPSVVNPPSATGPSAEPPGSNHSKVAVPSLPVDEEVMDEIRSLGEQHEMQWNDAMDLVNTAWWFRFLNSLEVNEDGTTQGDMGGLFDEFMEIPSWFKGGLQKQGVSTPMASASDDYEDFLQENSFGCLDFGGGDGGTKS